MTMVKMKATKGCSRPLERCRCPDWLGCCNDIQCRFLRLRRMLLGQEAASECFLGGSSLSLLSNLCARRRCSHNGYTRGRETAHYPPFFADAIPR